ncbi:MAG TPA: NAD(+) kinase [Steroidobacteraceae bacterium]|nr:NAD(+) kinase [Steroidobacteraceae bacterium]
MRAVAEDAAMNPSFKTCALVGRHGDPRVAESMLALARHLKASGRALLVDRSVSLDFGATRVTAVEESSFGKRADLVIAIGGDGTMLYAARLVATSGVPLLGINRGRLGFLTDVSPDDMLERLDDVLAGRFSEDRRTLLEARLRPQQGSEATLTALNDVVVQKWETGRMLDFETWIDGRYVNTHGSDGLIVASATGSTAYALSCGGPIIQPDLSVLVMVPISPHTLSDRPVVIPGGAQVEVRLLERPDTRAQVLCDGAVLGELRPDDRLLVGASKHHITLLHPPGYDYYRLLRSKLHWGRGAYDSVSSPGRPPPER